MKENVKVKSEVKTEVKTESSESQKVTVKNVTVVNVTSPSTIARIAKDKELNPQEVYVRCTFEYNKNLFTASNKLRFLTKSGYEELLEAKEKGTPMTFVVDIEKGFFYIEKDVAIDDLFKEEVKVVDNRADLKSLLG